MELLEQGCPNGETVDSVAARADKGIERIRVVNGNVLIFSHRDVLRVLTARWLRLPCIEARRFYLNTAAVSILGYHHNLDEPVIRLWNDTGR